MLIIVVIMLIGVLVCRVCACCAMCYVRRMYSTRCQVLTEHETDHLNERKIIFPVQNCCALRIDRHRHCVTI